MGAPPRSQALCLLAGVQVNLQAMDGMQQGNIDNSQSMQSTRNAEPGTRRWAFKTGGVVVSSPAVSPDGATVFVGSQDEHVYAIDAETGTRRWAFKTSREVYSIP